MDVAGKHSTRNQTVCLVFLLPAAVLGSLFLAWRVLAVFDFMYPTIYNAIGIDTHIERYAPLNRYRHGFEATTRDEHLRLFSEISAAIRDDGNGLGSIVYKDTDGKTLGVLLRPPEITHLTDVSTLVALLEQAGRIAIIVVVVLLLVVRLLPIELPTPIRLSSLAAAFVLLLCLGIWIVGPVDVFYGLHRWVFPSGNQWFFFYEESLMSTLMKAPDLFGYIAVLLLTLSLIIFWLTVWLASRLGTRSRPQSP
jgi:hypothetical protein